MAIPQELIVGASHAERPEKAECYADISAMSYGSFG
jgi:hypothetical protein